MLDADFFRRWMTATAASVEREAERLTDLDSPIGDADHGSNLQRGFSAVTAVLEKESPQTPGAVLMLAGRQLISTALSKCAHTPKTRSASKVDSGRPLPSTMRPVQ